MSEVRTIAIAAPSLAVAEDILNKHFLQCVKRTRAVAQAANANVRVELQRGARPLDNGSVVFHDTKKWHERRRQSETWTWTCVASSPGAFDFQRTSSIGALPSTSMQIRLAPGADGTVNCCISGQAASNMSGCCAGLFGSPDRVLQEYAQFVPEFADALQDSLSGGSQGSANRAGNEAVVPVATTAVDPSAEIMKLKQLLDAGAITQKEFEDKKTELLERI